MAGNLANSRVQKTLQEAAKYVTGDYESGLRAPSAATMSVFVRATAQVLKVHEKAVFQKVNYVTVHFDVANQCGLGSRLVVSVSFLEEDGTPQTWFLDLVAKTLVQGRFSARVW